MPDTGITLALIPARGGSKRVPGKNLADCAGKPLIQWTLDAALGAGSVDRVLVSTDSEAIADIARSAGLEVPFLRPAALSGDDVPMIDVMQHALNWALEAEGLTVKTLLLLQPTSPLRTATHIDEALALMAETAADTVVSVSELSHIEHPAVTHRLEDRLLHSFLGQNVAVDTGRKAYFRNGPAILANRRQVIEAGEKFGDRMAGYVMARSESVDIDEPFDLKLASMLLQERALQIGSGD